MVAIDTINSTPQADSLMSVGRIRANFDAMKVAVDAIEDGGYSGFPFERDGSIGSIPTRVQRGLYRTFSFPIWSAGVSEEDLSFALRVPFRWDGTTNPHIYFITVKLSQSCIKRSVFTRAGRTSDKYHTIRGLHYITI